MKKFLRIIFLRIPIGFVLFSLAAVLILKYVPVYYTPLMLKRTIEFRGDSKFRTEKKWTPIEKISPYMPHAAVLGEDGNFYSHNGFDWDEIENMLQEHVEDGKKIRGCSTISQQTAKNVFTLCTGTWLRKASEAWWTVLIELIWGKERIMEVYLNVAEMGKGIYGVEAASEHYFRHDASHMSRSESAALVCCLPNPLKRTPARMIEKNSAKYRRILRNL